jgi:O-antigen ligase
MQEDRGSERLDIYSNILNLLSTSSSQSLLFGHGGYQAVETKLKILAHNDFLEILYDFGIVTFIAYFVFFIQLRKYMGRILKYKKIIPIENRNAYIVAYILFLFLGMLNCFITSPVYYATLMFYFGLEIGNIERIIKTKNHFIISEQDY